MKFIFVFLAIFTFSCIPPTWQECCDIQCDRMTKRRCKLTWAIDTMRKHRDAHVFALYRGSGYGRGELMAWEEHDRVVETLKKLKSGYKISKIEVDYSINWLKAAINTHNGKIKFRYENEIIHDYERVIGVLRENYEIL